MSGILSAVIGSAGGGNVDFSVTTGHYVNTSEIFTDAYYGYNNTSAAPTFGSILPSPPLFRGATVVGVWSYGSYIGYADWYIVALNGDTTSTVPYITGLKVNGTQLVLGGGPNYAGSYIGPYTQYFLPLATSSASTLFGTTDGATIPVTIG
jgi:hypothetical protein